MINILIAILIWSSLGIILKISPLRTHDIIFFASITSSIILLIFFICKDIKQIKISIKLLITIFVISMVGLLNTFTFFYAYKNTTVSLSVLTHYTAPLFVAILAHIFLNEKISYKTILSILTATLGLFIMLNLTLDDFIIQIQNQDKNILGIISGLLSGLFYAILIILFKNYVVLINPSTLTMYQNMFVASSLAPFITLDYDWLSILFIILVLGILHSTIAPIIYLRGIKQVRANVAAILGYTEPIAAILLGIIFLDEKITINIFLGGCMILVSGLYCILSNKTNSKND